MALSLAAAAQPSETPTFKAGVSLVTVEVEVLAAATRSPVPDLKATDFRVFDNGAARNIEFFDFDSAPLDLVLFVDVSGWMGAQERNGLLGATRLALSELHPSDRVAVPRFAGRNPPLADFTSDVEEAWRTLLHARRPEKGRLFDAILQTARFFDPAPDKVRRHAVLTVTEDAESRSKGTREDVIRALTERDASLSALVVVTTNGGWTTGTAIGVPIPGVPPKVWRRDLPSGSEHWKSVKPIVDETGGAFIPQDESRYRLRELMARLRQRYLLGFYAPTTATREYHAIEVRLTEAAVIGRGELLVRARKGHYSAGEHTHGSVGPH